MTFTDYVIDIGLLALVLLQVRVRPLTSRSFVLPFVLIGAAAATYLRRFPTAGNDLLLVVAAAALGSAL